MEPSIPGPMISKTTMLASDTEHCVVGKIYLVEVHPSIDVLFLTNAHENTRLPR